MSNRIVLVDLSELGQRIDALDLDPKTKESIKARWLKYVEWWDSRARNAKRNYHLLRGTVIIAGELLPALVGLRELPVWGERRWIFAVASILASLVIAMCAGLE